VPFDYYHRLTRRQQAVYRKSDAIHEVPLGDATALRPLVSEAREHLESDRRHPLQESCQRLCDGLVRRLEVPPLTVRVLARRPSRTWGELHGLYEPGNGAPARITVWMRTAQRRQIVAFRTFFRTLLHEICHHLDYEHYRLAETYHTEGFFKRESSLFRQLADGLSRTPG